MVDNHSWSDIYNYYFQKGLLAFIINTIANIIMGLIISFAPVLLFGCCDWSKLGSAKRLSDFIVSFPQGWKNSNFFIKICTIMFLCYVILNITQFIFALPRFISLHRYFKDTLKVKDIDLYVMDWTDIIERIAKNDNNRAIDVLEIAQDILRFDNYITAFVTDPTILTWQLPYMDEPCHFPMSRFFFYLFKISLNGTVLDQNGASIVSGAQTIRIPQAQNQLNTRFKIIGILLFIISPFVFSFEVLYLIFHYFQAIKNSPSSLSLRRWSPHAKWAIREYNELPHVFNERLSKSYYFANLFIDMFPPSAIQPVLKLICFLCGSLIAIILIVGIATDISSVVFLHIFGGKTLAWLLTIFASIYSVCHGLIRDESTIQDPEDLYKDVKKYIHYDFTDDNNTARSWETQKRFSDFFQPIWEQILLELCSCIINPIVFTFVLPKKTTNIVEFVRKNSVEHPRLSWICSFASFQDKSVEQQNDMQSCKVRRSISNFKLVTNTLSYTNLIGFDEEDVPTVAEGETPLVTRVASPPLTADLLQINTQNNSSLI